MVFREIFRAVLLAGSLGWVCTPSTVSALPFNQDMVGNQLVTGAIMRPKPPGSVAMGSVECRVELTAKPQDLVNPNPGNAASILNGKRLFEVNCQVCHGRWEDGKHIGNSLNAPGFEARNLADRTFVGSGGSYAEMLDGRIFLAVHFGKGIMPAYGWKFSTAEHWDLVNYVQSVRATGK